MRSVSPLPGEFEGAYSGSCTSEGAAGCIMQEALAGPGWLSQLRKVVPSYELGHFYYGLVHVIVSSLGPRDVS